MFRLHQYQSYNHCGYGVHGTQEDKGKDAVAGDVIVNYVAAKDVFVRNAVAGI